MDPADLFLLSEHQSLLNIDFDKLATGTAMDRQLWLAEMESAMAAAHHVRDGSRQALRTATAQVLACLLELHTQTQHIAGIDSEGSMRWRRCRC